MNVFHVNISDKIVAFHRWENWGIGDDVVIVVNFANRAYETYTIGFPRGGDWKVRFNSDWNGYSPIFSNHPGYMTPSVLLVTAMACRTGAISGLALTAA